MSLSLTLAGDHPGLLIIVVVGEDLVTNAPGLRTSYNPASCFLGRFLCGGLRAGFTFRDASVLGTGLVNFGWILKRDSLLVESRY